MRPGLSLSTSFFSLLLLTGCGADPGVTDARSTLAASTRVTTDASTDVDAHEALGPPLRNLEVRLQEAEHAVDVWEETGTGKLAWLTTAACLASALERLAEAYREQELPVPPEVQQAQAMVEGTTNRDCTE